MGSQEGSHRWRPTVREQPPPATQAAVRNQLDNQQKEAEMLVLSRKVGDSIQIGDSIKIRVSRISGSRVTLGIEAPESVRIVRGELKPIVEAFEIEIDQEEMGDPKTEQTGPLKRSNRVRPSIPEKKPSAGVTSGHRLSRLASSSMMAK